MATLVVFAFAVADGLLPVVGAAPYDVLARQLPRALVTRLNGSGDRGARFFPFLGPVDGARTFLRLGDLFEPNVLAQLHRQGDVELLCDAVFRPGVLHWRAIDGRTLAVRCAADLPFDAKRPLDVLPRLEFELAGLLGWTGRPAAQPTLAGEALGWFLVLKDALLRREASLPDGSADVLRPARRCVELAPDDAEVQSVVLDFATSCLKRGEARDDVVRLLGQLATATDGSPPMLERLATLLHAGGDEDSAASVTARAALLAPEREGLVERAAAQLFRLERYAEVREVVDLARARGLATPAALAQLAAVCDRQRDLELRRELVAELTALPDLPVPVARLVVSFLLEEQRPALARTVAERALAKAPDHALLQFELGRTCLLLDDAAAASSALRRAISLGLPPFAAGQAARFLRLSAVPGLWLGTQRVEDAIARGDLDGALAAVRDLVRRVGRVAEAWFLLGVVRHKLAQPRRAERALRRAVRCDDTLADAHNRLGILLVSAGRLAEGHTHLERAHALAPTDASPLLHLAQACALLGRQEDGERHLAAAERAGADPALVLAVRREIFAPRG